METLLDVVFSSIVPTLCFRHLFTCNWLVSTCAVNYSRWPRDFVGTWYYGYYKSASANLYELEPGSQVERDWHLAEFRFVHLDLWLDSNVNAYVYIRRRGASLFVS